MSDIIDNNTSNAVEADFEALGLAAELIAALDRLKIDEPTEIQRKMIPNVLAKRDILARACTGAGKTNTYMLPILQTVAPDAGVQAIVVQPTHSLCLQLQRNMSRFSPEKPLKIVVVGGGREAENALGGNPDVIITIPRGATTLNKQAGLDLSTVKLLVLDEVDAVIDERGDDELLAMHELLDQDHQTIVLTSELNDDVRNLAEQVLNDAVEVESTHTPIRALAAKHSYFEVSPEDKFEALLSFCKQEKPKLAIVFTQDEEVGREIAHRLDRAYVNCRWVYERHSRGRRDRNDRKKSRSSGDVIVACDPSPRRLSTIPATHLLHYDLPQDIDGYLLRLQQASRLRRAGDCVLFCEPDQKDVLAEIEERIDKSLVLREPLKAPERRRGRGSDRSPSGGGRRGDKREGGRRGDSSRTSGGKGGAPAKAKDADLPQARHNELLHRNQDLESRGVQPPPKTLGSRFRTNRRPKQLRRPS